MFKDKLDIYAILLAGGSGTRLWPISREESPKQFSTLIGSNGSHIQSNYKRLTNIFHHKRISILARKEHEVYIQEHLSKYSSEIGSSIISEPVGRNTFAAILLGTLNILKELDDAIIFVFPADHFIEDSNNFYDSIKNAEVLARDGFLVTFGVTPTHSATDYGYIEAGKKINDHALSISRFIEKPDRATAEGYIKKGDWFWNSGIFVFKASLLISECEKHCKEAIDKFSNMDLNSLSTSSYQELPNIPFDKAIMELTDKGVVLPVSFNWSDIGSWKAVYDHLPKGDSGNVTEGNNVVVNSSSNCLIKAGSRLIVVSGLSDLIVIDTDDAVLISDMDSTDEVKLVVNDLKKSGKSEVLRHKTISKSWGYITDLHCEQEYRVRKLVVKSGSKLSLPKDVSLSDNCIISKGVAKVTRGKETEVLRERDKISLSSSTAQIENTGDSPLHIVEVQFGKTEQNLSDTTN